MPANRLYHTWSDQIRQPCPTARNTLVHNFTCLLIGIYLSGKVHLSAVANKLPGSAKLPSTVQRLRRLLQSAICVRKWYGCVSFELKAMRPGLASQESPTPETGTDTSAYGVDVCEGGDTHPSRHSQLQLADGAGAPLHPESNAYRTTHNGL